MATIKQIDGRTVHQIQSGQVIVDLCSVVKELVENSVDSGATIIDVRFKNQGLDSIEVQDNGSGISPANYSSVALKHYTSKLSSYSDIESLQTFGFRGEALASLCALSVLTVTTCLEEDVPKGSRLTFRQSGELEGTTVVAAQRGTTVTVENLFHNLPVRRRELDRNIKREWHKVIALLNQYACILTNVKFSVSQQPTKGKRIVLFSTKGNPSTRDNIINIFGAKTLAALIPLDLHLELQPSGTRPDLQISEKSTPHSHDVRIVGHVSKPVHGEGRQTPDRQMFFVNGRPCLLPQLAKAFNEVYRSYNNSQSPFIFADVQLDTMLYDVNVSPDKRSILLHDQNTLLDTLRISLSQLFDTQENSISIAASTQDTKSQSSHNRLTQPGRLARMFDKAASRSESVSSTPPVVEPSRSPEVNSSGSMEDSQGSEEDNGTPPASRSVTAPSRGDKMEKFRHKEDEDDDHDDEEDHDMDSASEIGARPSPDTKTPKTPRLKTVLVDRSPSHEGSFAVSSASRSPGRPRRLFSSVLTESAEVYNPVSSAAPEDITLDIGSNDLAEAITPAREVSSASIASEVAEEASEPEQSHSTSAISGKAKAFLLASEVYSRHTEPVMQQPFPRIPNNVKATHDDVPAGQSGHAMQSLETEAEPVVRLIRPTVSSLDSGSSIGTANASAPPLESTSQLSKAARRKDATTCLIQNLHIGKGKLRVLQNAGPRRQSSLSVSTARDTSSVERIDASDAESKLPLIISKGDFSRMRIVGQFNLGFIIAVKPANHTSTGTEAKHDELFIIDQHASDEKYNYERLQRTTEIQSQRLVHPKRLQLTALEEEIILENAAALNANGFKVETDTSGRFPVGSRCQLTSLPLSREVTFKLDDLEELISLLGDNSSESSYLPRPSKVRKMLAMRACRSSIMIGKAMTRSQMYTLVNHLGELDKPWNCPHGRPTIRHLSRLQAWSGVGWAQDIRPDSIETWQSYVDEEN
ncbi:DNA mismatch repair protein MutL [Trichoderma citrinoviride]|uniref:DNA mismatch repair protein PMS1 n=1 Tax=Trichoderma citrinoviride TaxID=58853 RepID=A0A2T4B3Y1_9HYPO|nr:DNA mismatch repair protein MutL [Trichoderma citrinoviride]PTB64046.1 DNA mismatch repair protein MutL [Trichoderma citrinoviride]